MGSRSVCCDPVTSISFYPSVRLVQVELVAWKAGEEAHVVWPAAGREGEVTCGEGRGVSFTRWGAVSR